MLHRVLTAAAALSLLICVATIALWIYSRHTHNEVYLIRGDKQTLFSTKTFVLDVAAGEVTIEYGHEYADLMPENGWHSYAGEPLNLSDATTSFGWKHDVLNGGLGGWDKQVITFPLLLASLLFAIGPTLAVRRHLILRVVPSNACRKCGYNLTGNTSGVCPECGTVIPGLLSRLT